VACAQPWRRQRLALFEGSAQHAHFAHNRLDGFAGHAARAQQRRRVGRHVQDGRLYPYRRRARVQHGVDLAAEVVQHMVGGGGAGASELVCAGRGNGRHAVAYQRTRHRVLRDAYRHRVAPRRDDLGDDLALGQHQRQRPRHKRANELLGQHGVAVRVAVDVFRLGDMHN
jgi:hypothetical protein